MDFEQDPTFKKIVALVVSSEGGYSDDPRDPGGPTKYGIAWNFNADYLKKNFGLKSSADMKNLTVDQARQCYYDKYYLASGAKGLTDVDLAYIHFDCAVNQGVGIAKKFLDSLSPNPRYFDGSGGKNRLMFLKLFMKYVQLRLDRYAHSRKELKAAYLSGWVNRMVDVMENSEELD